VKTYTIVNMKLYGSESLVRSLEPGAPLTLTREPTNPHDPNAIKVWSGGQVIGYIGRGRAPGPKYAPGKDNELLARHLDEAAAKASVAVESLMMPAKLVGGWPPGAQVE
jgi:hypothetical protein